MLKLLTDPAFSVKCTNIPATSMPSDAVAMSPVPEGSGSRSAENSASLIRAAARQTAARASLATLLRASSPTASASASTSVACSRRSRSAFLRLLMSCMSECSSVRPSTSARVRASSTGNRDPSLCRAGRSILASTRPSFGTPGVVRDRRSSKSGRSSGGMIISGSQRPMASSAVQPNVRSADLFQAMTNPESSVTT